MALVVLFLVFNNLCELPLCFIVCMFCKVMKVLCGFWLFMPFHEEAMIG